MIFIKKKKEVNYDKINSIKFIIASAILAVSILIAILLILSDFFYFDFYMAILVLASLGIVLGLIWLILDAI